MAKREQIDILFKMHADLQEMKKLQQQTAQNKKQLGEVGKLLKSGLGMAVGIASFGALTEVIRRNTLAAIENGAAIFDNAKLYGVSAEFLQTWRYAAEQNGIQIQQSDVALQRFTRRLGEAAQGKGELLPIIKQYGIQLKDAAGNTRSNVDVLGDFSELLKNTKDPAERLRIAFKLFDSEGAKLASVLADGKDGLAGINQEMRETNKLISEDNVAALKRASDAMTAFGTELKATFANATAEVWTTVEAIMFLAEERKKDASLQERAIAELAGIEYDSLPNSERARQQELARARRDAGLSNEQIDTKVEQLKIAAIKEQIRLRKEELATVREQEAAAAAAAEEEANKAALAAQRAALEASIAEHEEQMRYERLSIEDKLAYQLERRAELEELINNTVLTEEERNEKLREQEQVLKRILDLELKIEGSKDGRGGGDSPRAEKDPLQDFADRMQDAQNPQLIILNSMEAMYESINQQVQELIAGTITWEQALRNVGGAILSSVVSTFAQMAAAAIAGYIATQLGIKAIQATALAETMAMGTMAAASWIPAAIAASIATMGAAAGVGAASFAMAMLAGAAAASLAAGVAGFGMAALGGAGTAAGTPGMAAGGLVQGPGTGTSDSIPTRLSNGEFVMRAAAVDAYGPDFMANINAMRAPKTPAVKIDLGASGRVAGARRREKRDTTVLNIDGPNELADAVERQRGDLIKIKRRLGMA